MADRKEILVIVKKPDGETIVIRDPEYLSYPDSSQPYWVIVKDKNEIRTTGQVWVESVLGGNEVICEDSVVCTGMRCFHRLPHERTEECGKFCEGANRAHDCTPYRIG